MCKLLAIDKHRSTAYHPQTNGLLERYNRTLKQMLRCFTNRYQTDWDHWLPQVNYAYNTTVQASTGFSPFHIIYGFKPVAAIHDLQSIHELDTQKLDPYIQQLKERLDFIHKLVNQNTIRAVSQQQKHYNLHATLPVSFNIGSLVKIVNYTPKPGLSKSLLQKYVGPYKVLRQIGKVNYELLNTQTQAKYITHINRLQSYYQTPPATSRQLSQQAVSAQPNTTTKPSSKNKKPPQPTPTLPTTTTQNTIVTRFGRTSCPPKRFGSINA